MSATTTQYLDKDGLDELWGKIVKFGPYFTNHGTGSADGWAKLATLKCLANMNSPIVIHVLNAGKSVSSVEFMLNKVSTTTPTVASCKVLVDSFADDANLVGYTYADVSGVREYTFWKKRGDKANDISVKIDCPSAYNVQFMFPTDGTQLSTEPTGIEYGTKVYDSVSAQTAYTSQGSATKVPQITTNEQGQVTGITEVTISGVTPASHTHGDITNDGKLGSTANLAMVTGTGGKIATADLTTAAPSASGNALDFIDSVSQDSKGKISATKKSVTVDSTYSADGTNPVNGKAIADALDTLDVDSVGGSGKYISAISESNGKISATSTSMDTAPTTNSQKAVTSGGIKTALDGKQDTLDSQTAYTSKGSETKVPQITTNSLGQVTGITEVTISGVTPASHSHGDITNDGKIGSTADLAVVTGTSGAVTTANLTTADPGAEGTTLTAIATVSQDSRGKITATKKTIQSASTSQKGVVQLNDNINSTSTTEAATANAVKTAYDLANGKQDPITFDGTYNASTNKAATVSTVTDAINALDGNLNSTTPGAGKTLTAFSQTNGVVSATFGSISITKSQVSDFPTSMTPTSHAHGNIANGGTLTDTAAAAAGNDYVVIRDAADNKIQTSTIKGTDVADAVSKKHSHSTLTLSTTAQAYDGTHTLALPASDPYTSARTPVSHTHGNITNDGKLNDTAAAAAGNDYVVIRDAENSKVQTSTIKGTDVADAVTKKHEHSTLTLSKTAQAYDGTHTLALPSDDPYTTARTPASHTHGNITNDGKLNDTAAAAAGNDYVVIRDADNAKIQTSTIKGTDVADAVTNKHSHADITLSKTAQAYDGTHTIALPSDDPYTTARTPASHSHGNIANGGTLQDDDVAIASGDKLVITDSSNSGKVARASVSFDGSTATKALTQKGTWETFNNYTHPTTTAASAAAVKVGKDSLGHVVIGNALTAGDVGAYSKSEVDSMLTGRISIVTALPTTGEAGVIYYVGPSGTGSDQYDEYIWDGSAFIKVGEKSLDLSNYVNTLSSSGSGSVVTAISKSGNTITYTKGNISVDNLSNWASSTDVTVSSATYHTWWPVAPTSSNQVYGLSIKDGKLYQVYNNKGSYSVRPYDQDNNTTYTNKSLGQGYGTCATEAATAEKTVTMADYVQTVGGVVVVKFSNALCASATLNINSKGAKPVYIKGAAVTASNAGAVAAGDTATFFYDGTAYHLIGTDRAVTNPIVNITRSGTTFTATRLDGSTFTFDQQDNNTTYTQEKLGQGYGTCTTEEATAAKSVSLENYVLVKNGVIAVKFTYGLCTSATLNVNSQGAKPIYIHGAAVTATTAKEVLAGDIALFMYDGSQYQFMCSDRLNKAAITGLSVSGQTVTYTKADGTTGTITTQDTTYSFDGTYNASSNKAATVSTVTNKINALDVSDITGFGAGKTLATLTETDGKIAATFQDISITKSQVSDFSHAHGNITNAGAIGSTSGQAVYTTDNGVLTAGSLATTDPTASGTTTTAIATISQDAKGKITVTKKTISGVTPASHTHGNIQNDGTLQTNDVTIASGDKLVITDSSNSSKVARASVSFDGSTTTTALTPKGTFESFAKSSDITSAINALDVSTAGGDGKYIKAISETDGKISATVETMDTTPTASSTKAVTSGGVKTALDAKANLASPALTGTPTAPTATAGTNTTQIATTAFVQNSIPTAITASDINDIWAI